ncbi:hypothetical protein Ae406Ps2_3794c [Pseudonocardia sp. Ae406_Ps2]|nr:hypothetical protein Ae331Ps2_2146 [Pseudonocardia sp. Ae331_Ps2]OLM03794.1 hypothetical protein Ae406Ps2_3794c [Pseudonocardia sp. Ae406_Ps2]OLM11353.1 hypothetical protein Ae505Ps2_1477 [Pseudonocardia sp. Ae505_Ps2]OLM25351.1 hypothetical protein Ae706Ps2_3784c [Pseudonocardia sp. Ae706_Ps2]
MLLSLPTWPMTNVKHQPGHDSAASALSGLT